MMKSMGWEGGALGAREGGIMEPIMPAIHLEKNAGLGHVKEKTKASFKMDILELILALLDKDTSISIMDIKSPLSKKETAYLHRINKNFNDRKKPDLAKKEEIILAKKILKFMINNPRLKFFITSNEKRIKLEKLEEPALIWKNESEIKAEPVVKQTIQKTINQPTINQSNLSSAIQSNQSTNQTENEKQSTIEIAKRKLEKAIKQPTNQSVKNQSEDLLTSDEILSLIKRKMTANSLKHLKTRMYLLKVCLDFFKSNHTDVTINRTFRGKSKGFVEKMCGFINTRRGQFATDIEEMFWKEILCHLGETYVMNHHRDKNTCTLTKVRKDQVLTQVQNCHEIDNFIKEDSSDEELIRKAEEYNIKNINFLENGVSYFDINSYDSRVTAKLHKPEISREIFDSQQQEIKNKKTANFNIAIMKNSCSININHVRISNGTQPMTAETAGKIQNKILDSIRNSNFSFLPNLKCHGVKKNFLIYTCYDSRTLEYLKCILRDYSVLEFEDCEKYKMVLHIKSFSKFDVFSWLQHYYSELKIEKWTLVLTAQYEDRLLLTVTLDKESFLFICNNNFRLFIGIDEVVFDVSF